MISRAVLILLSNMKALCVQTRPERDIMLLMRIYQRILKAWQSSGLGVVPGSVTEYHVPLQS